MTVDDYLAQLPEGQRLALQRVRDIVLDALPGCEEVMSYGMPTYKVDGKQVLNMAAFKNHLSLFGNVEAFADELADFMMSGRGTVQFTQDKPVPEKVIRAILASRSTSSSK